MDIKQYWDMVRLEIDEEMIGLLSILMAGDLPVKYREVLALCLEGGKRLRGTLICLVCQALGGHRDKALKGAAAVEYIHASTLVHDDIIDGDRWRRNHPTIWTLEGIGQDGAIVLGDLLYAFGVKVFSDIGWQDTAVVAEAMVKVATGELKEILGPRSLIEGSSVEMPSATFFDEVIKLKTGALFGASCKLGALAANAMDFSGKAYDYGQLCGETFQIADDIVDGSEDDEKHLMMTRMSERTVLAIKAIDSFPDNEYTAILRQMPEFMTDLMLQGNS